MESKMFYNIWQDTTKSAEIWENFHEKVSNQIISLLSKKVEEKQSITTKSRMLLNNRQFEDYISCMLNKTMTCRNTRYNFILNHFAIRCMYPMIICFASVTITRSMFYTMHSLFKLVTMTGRCLALLYQYRRNMSFSTALRCIPSSETEPKCYHLADSCQLSCTTAS